MFFIIIFRLYSVFKSEYFHKKKYKEAFGIENIPANFAIRSFVAIFAQYLKFVHSSNYEKD